MIGTVVLAGEAMGLATAVCWAFSASAWSFAGRHVGAVVVACLRITLASIILAAAHYLMFGKPFPTGLSAEALWMLAASGALGAGVGDLCFFRGLVLIGPRLGMMITALVPFLSAGIAYFTPLRETLGAGAVAGMMLTVGGVVCVVAEPRGRRAWPAPPGQFKVGLAMCLAGAALISLGLVLSKMGMKAGPGAGVEAFPATLVRVVAGTAVAWIALPLLGRARTAFRAVRHARAMAIIVAGTVVGPVVGMWLSMEALKHTAETGVAAALMGTSPIVMIPIAYLAYGDRPTLRTVAGTAVAVAGVAVLILRHLPG